MIVGGGPSDSGVATTSADVADLSAGQPAYTPAAPMNLARIHLSAVLLPDRAVLVTGGSAQRENRQQAALPAEIYDPAADTWTQVAAASVARLYHSVALLLPDARVVVAGGNPPPFGSQVPWEPPDPNEELRIEVYSPPYLFRGPRPEIASVPVEWRYGDTVDVSTPDADRVRWASLVRPGVTTHSYNTSQRLVDLPISRQGGGAVTVEVTGEPNLAPPGWYMLFLTDTAGVPSVAAWVHLQGAPQPATLSGYAQEVLATPGLAGYWRLDETGGTVAFDAHAGRHGRYVNAPRLGVPGPDGGTGTGFDGTGQYVDLPRLVADDFSLELWFQARSGTGIGNRQWWQGAGLFDGEVPGVVNDFGTSLDTQGRVWAGTGNPDVSLHSDPGLADGAWHHVVFTRVRASGTITLYVDGAQVATGRAGTAALSSPPALRVGMLQSGLRPLTGAVAHAAAYTVALPAATVARHHA